MTRRDFLLKTGAALLGLAGLAEIGEAAPMIKKTYLSFNGYDPRPSTDFIVIHHTGLSVDKDSTAAQIHGLHRDLKDWAGIGYHYLIRKDGTIEQGRAPELMGAHTYGHNQNSVGICLAGNYELAEPPEKQFLAAKELVAWLGQKYKLKLRLGETVLGHCDLNRTDCPGKYLYRRLPELAGGSGKIMA